MPERYLFTVDRNLRFSSGIKDLAFQEVLFPAGDGPRLYGWYLPGSNSRQVILFFHGTATNLSHLTPLLKELKRLHTAIFAIDYRGFGRSGGRPTEAGTYQDARGALAYLLRLGWAPDQIIYYGHSLGAAIALQLALDDPPSGLVLESPFTSIPDLIHYHHPWIFSVMPWAFPPFYDNRAKIGSLRTPLLIFQGRRDTIVPPQMARTLYSLAPNPKILDLVPRAGHADVPRKGGKRYWATWRKFLDQVAGRGHPLSPAYSLSTSNRR